MALPVAATGAVKVKTAKEMAAFAKAMQKTDWDGVNNAMQSIKDFGVSASVVQETMGDIKDMGDSLKNLALGDLMANLSTKASELYDALEPYAIMLGNITKNLDISGLDQFITNLKIFNLLIENSDQALKNLLDWLLPIIYAVLGITPPGTPGSTLPYPPDFIDPGVGF